jgi:hypothetical protein
MKTLRRIWLLAAVLVSGLCIVSFVIWFASAYLVGGGPGERLRNIAISESRIPVVLTIFGRSSDTISARLAFFTADGNQAGILERSWQGWELKIDCVVVRSGEGWLVFPFMLYTDETRYGKGIDLVRYYNHKSFPLLFDSSSLDKNSIKALKRVFSLVLSERWMPSFLGTLHHETVSIRSFEAGAEYSLFVTKEGTLRLRVN